MVIKRGLKAVAGLLIVLGITACGNSATDAESQATYKEVYYLASDAAGLKRDAATKLIQTTCKVAESGDMAIKVYVSHLLDTAGNNTLMRKHLAVQAEYGVLGFCPEHEGKFDDFLR